MVTESMLLGWLLWCGAVSGAIIGGIIGPLMAASEDRGFGYSALCGIMPGVGGGAIVTSIAGFILGATVPLYDVAGNPGVLRGIVYGMMGFMLGGSAGIVGGGVGGLLGWPLRRRP